MTNPTGSMFYPLLRSAARARNKKYRLQRKVPKTAILNDGEQIAEWLGVSGTRGLRKKVRLSEAIHRYSEGFLRPLKSEVRYRAARNILLKISEIIGPDIPVSKLTEADLAALRDRLLLQGYKPASVNRYLSLLGNVLTVCCDQWRIIKSVPWLPKLKERRLDFRYLTEAEEQRLLSRCGLYLRRLVVFLLGTGARKGEALSLTWNDVFIEPDRRSWVRFRKTKNGRPHSVPLPSHLADMLIQMKAESPPNLGAVFWYVPKKDHRAADGHVRARRGVAKEYLWPDRDFRAARMEAGLRDVRIHDLRHTYASRLIAKGVSLIFVNRLLNHADLEQTARYAHFSTVELGNSVSVLDSRNMTPEPVAAKVEPNRYLEML